MIFCRTARSHLYLFSRASHFRICPVVFFFLFLCMFSWAIIVCHLVFLTMPPWPPTNSTNLIKYRFFLFASQDLLPWLSEGAAWEGIFPLGFWSISLRFGVGKIVPTWDKSFRRPCMLQLFLHTWAEGQIWNWLLAFILVHQASCNIRGSFLRWSAADVNVSEKLSVGWYIALEQTKYSV